MSPKHKQLFIIGGQRSGTTYLTNLLNQHPKIRFTDPIYPETKFFIRQSGATKDEFEKTHFSKLCQDEIMSEKSTSYYENETALQTINQNFPNALIIFIYRNPVDRAISNYAYSKKNGLETRTMEEVFVECKPISRSFNVSVDPFNYLGRSRFTEIIPRLEQIFSDNLIFINFDHLVADFETVVDKVVARLGLGDGFKPSGMVGRNETSQVKISEQVLLALQKELQAEEIFLKKHFK